MNNQKATVKNPLLKKRNEIIADEYSRLYNKGFRPSFIKKKLIKKYNKKYGLNETLIQTILTYKAKELKVKKNVA